MFGWLFKKKSSESVVDVPAKDVPLKKLNFSRFAGHLALRTSLNIDAEILYRDDAYDCFDWIDIKITRLCGEEGERGWTLVREICGFSDRWTGERVLDVHKIYEIRIGDRAARDDIGMIARVIRLAAGGINQRDFDELAAMKAEEERLIPYREWEARSGKKTWRKINPALDCVVTCTENDKIVTYAFSLQKIETWGDKIGILIGEARKVKGRNINRIYFTIPDTTDPHNEILSFSYDGAQIPPDQISDWLNTNHLKPKKKPAGKKTDTATADVSPLPESINGHPEDTVVDHSDLRSYHTSDPAGAP